ncbi:MAG: hypothetical protein ACKOCB_09825 [Planctomycetia bacterium]
MTGLERTIDLTGIRVAPGPVTRWLLRVDAVRAVLQVLGAPACAALAAEPAGWLTVLGAVVGVPAGLGGAVTVPAWLPWALLAHGLLTLLVIPACLRVEPRGMTARRRLGMLAVAEVLFLGVGGAARSAAVVLWTGVLWIAMLTAGLRLSREVARLSGEEGLEVDPSRPRI